jgi:hypothetical protein
MPEVCLYGSRVVPIIRELVPGRVPEHVRVNRKGEASFPACSRNELADRCCCQRTAALRCEHVGACGVIALQPTKRAKLRAAKRMRRRRAALTA